MNDKYCSLMFELINSKKLIAGESGVFDYIENLTFEDLEDIYDNLSFYVNFDEMKEKYKKKEEKEPSIFEDEKISEIDWGGDEFEKLTESYYEEDIKNSKEIEGHENEKLMDIVVLVAMIVQLETAKDTFLTQEQVIKYLSIFMIDISLEMLRREGKIKMIGKSYLTKDGSGTFERDEGNYEYD